MSSKTGISKKDVETVVETAVDAIIDELVQGREVVLTGFGTFIPRTRHARGGVNPQKPNERIRIPEVRVAKFKTGKTLKDALKGKPKVEAPKEFLKEEVVEEKPAA